MDQSWKIGLKARQQNLYTKILYFKKNYEKQESKLKNGTLSYNVIRTMVILIKKVLIHANS